MPSATRRDLLALACGLSAAGALWRWGTPESGGGAASPPPVSTPDASSSGASGAGPDGTGVPARLVIPAIQLDEPVAALGLNSEGQMVPPANTVQWYTGSVAPGRPGICVIAGHVTYSGPDVFHRLPSLRVGDLVAVTARTGEVTQFAVTRTRQVDKQELTSDPSVWGDTDERVLALITCDPDSPVREGHLAGNFVAWASPVSHR